MFLMKSRGTKVKFRDLQAIKNKSYKAKTATINNGIEVQ